MTVNAPGPLPVIMEICEEIGPIEAVNETVEWDEAHCHLAPGQRIAALIMNVLIEGVVLYHVDDFFEQTDTNNICTATDPTDEVTPADLADHNLRSAIDKLVGAGPRTVLMAVFQEAMAREGIDTNVLHGDVTTFSVQGTYEPDAEDADKESPDITYGPSKSRKDLKQFNTGLVVNQAGVPVVGDIMDGFASELDWNRKLVDEPHDWTDPDAPLIYIGDSKALPKETLEHCVAEDIDLITRVPHNYNTPDEFIDQAWEAEDWTNVGTFVQDNDDDDEAAEYRLQSFITEIHERTLRGILVNASELDGRTERRIEYEFSRTEDALEEAVEDLEDRYFVCEPDAESAARLA